MSWLADPLRGAKRRAAKLRNHLADLTHAVDHALAAIDAEMAKPSTVERGRRVAMIANQLQLENDSAKRFGLAPRRTGLKRSPESVIRKTSLEFLQRSERKPRRKR